MKNVLLALIAGFVFFFQPPRSQALFGEGDIVYDPAAVAQLIESIERLTSIFDQLKDIKSTINKWANIDHINLAGGKFFRFLSKYKDLFNQIVNEIEGYQNGGMLGQIERLDEIYFAYHANWEGDDPYGEEADPHLRQLRKQLLWTKIQFKHAAKVAATIRDGLPDTEEQLDGLLDDTAQAVGIMQSIKIGNQISGMVAKSVQTLNVAMAELIQAQAGEGLERNSHQGLINTRNREAIEGWGENKNEDPPVPLNPIHD